jgi:hypothetical protein
MKLPNLYPSDEPHRYDDWLNSNKGTKTLTGFFGTFVGI